jgi:hypothetical protein
MGGGLLLAFVLLQKNRTARKKEKITIGNFGYGNKV